jgi:hypothetical protein
MIKKIEREKLFALKFWNNGAHYLLDERGTTAIDKNIYSGDLCMILSDRQVKYDHHLAYYCVLCNGAIGYLYEEYLVEIK